MEILEALLDRRVDGLIIARAAGSSAGLLERIREEMSEVQVLEEYQALMLDLQRLAMSNGNLAIGWIALMASLGSRTPVVLHAPHVPEAAALRARPRMAGALSF